MCQYIKAGGFQKYKLTHHNFECNLCFVSTPLCKLIEHDANNLRGFNLYCLKCDRKRQIALINICVGGDN